MATATRKSATAKKVTVKKVEKVERVQDSVTGTFIRGKRDRKTGVIDTDHMPTGDGGVRFEDQAGVMSPEYVTQEDFKLLGNPTKVRKTLKALA